MATLPPHVKPGDLITADLINALLDEIALLQEIGERPGTQVVPNVFGTFLRDARALITQPARQLTLGFIFDVSGAAIDPFASQNANLIVLNQSPAADARVLPNTPVNLVVSQSTSSSTPTEPAPTITRLETVTGTVTTSFPVNATMVIVGANFSANAAQNVVRFDGIPATVIMDPTDPTRRLFAVIPTGIPGAPVASSDPPKTGVVVMLQIQNGSPVTTNITVSPPLDTQPRISGISPTTQFENSNITITGVNFAATAQVLIRDVNATIVGTPTNNQIIATVPDFGFPEGPPVPSSVKVVVGDAEDIFLGTFRVRPSVP
ncbi:PASTA domain-containing protein [Nitrosomonas nitrosa]|uniref:PASTA domain-containing protein n=1 Tax=Nitrosomonas nitrosa TaxID=52442 RepID=UPI0023F82EB5|nr:PASTA domain-containing protein [Nitrosomonas nitrosa]MCO6435109.1 IPT/TIG domain-containing protein [Nitrosomonas nitrosa]